MPHSAMSVTIAAVIGGSIALTAHAGGALAGSTAPSRSSATSSTAAAQTKPERDLAAIIANVKQKFPDVRHVNTDHVTNELAKRDVSGVQLIDVREPAEFAAGHIEGAINVPPGISDKDLLARIDPDRPVLAYCAVGYRSAVMAQRLQRAGRTNVSSYAGSIFAWANAGKPIQSSSGPATTVHPYNATWGRYLNPEKRGSD